MPVPYTFGTRTSAIPLSELDANFNTPVTIGNTTVGLGNTVTSVGNLTLTNVTITSGTINASVVDSGYTANAVIYANSTGVLTDGSANLTFNGTTLRATDITDASLTSGRITYATTGGNLTDSAGLTFDGTNFATTGTATATRFIPSGSTVATNGMYLPAANSLGFSTNSAEAMRIDSSGVVGINASSNLRGNLEVRRASLSAFTGTSLGNIVVSDSAATADYFIPIDFAVNPTTANAPLARIAAQRTSSGSYLYFGTSSSYVSGVTNSAMVIDYVGNVGIGTSSPNTTCRLDISQTSRTRFDVSTATVINTVTNAAANAYATLRIDSADYQFYTGNSEKMRIDSSGNVGIGTSSPVTKLDVNGIVTVRNTGAAFNTTPNTNYGLNFQAANSGVTYITSYSNGGSTDLAFATNSGGGAASERMRITSAGLFGFGLSDPTTFSSGVAQAVIERTSAGNNTVALALVNRSGTANTSVSLDFNPNTNIALAQIRAFRTDTGFGGATDLRFLNYDGSALAERMRISSNGDVYIACTNNNETTSVGIRAEATGAFSVTRSESTSAASTLDVYSTGASLYRFYVNMAGTVFATSTTITGISDGRLKENVRDLDDGLNAVMALKPRKFDWKEGKGKNIKDDRGFIAQEFETVFPDMIETWKDPAPEGEEPYKGVNPNLIPTLVKAIQEQQAMIVELTNRIKKLEGAK